MDAIQALPVVEMEEEGEVLLVGQEMPVRMEYVEIIMSVEIDKVEEVATLVVEEEVERKELQVGMAHLEELV
jgi:hypothetical protein